MKNKTFFFKVYIAFILCFITPIIIFVSLFNPKIVTVIEKEVIRTNYERLQVVETYFKNIQEQNDRIYSTLIANKQFLELLKQVDSTESPEDLNYKIFMLQELLKQSVQGYDKISSVHVYRKGAELIIGTDNIIEHVNQDTGGRWLHGDGPLCIEDNVFRYTYSVHDSTGSLIGIVSINMPEYNVSKIINNSNSLNQYIYMADKNNIIVSHPQKMRINQTLDEELADPHLINSDKYIVSEDYNGQKSLTTVLDSYYSGIKYISVNNYNLIMKEVMGLKNVIYWSVLILLIFGFFVSYYSAKKLYLPIQMIINKITSKKNTAFDMNKNELSAIGDVIADMFQKEEYLNDFFEWNKNNIRQSSIRQMFFGELKTRQEYADIGITFDKTCYMAIIVWHKELPENYHYKIIIEETFEEKLSENYRCYGVPDEKNTIAFILNFDGNDQLEEIETTLRTLLLEIKNLISNNIIITLGDITVSLNDVKRSYIAAKEALRYKIFVSGGIIPAWQFANVQTTNYNPKREMQKLISAIQFQEHEEVQVAANELFATLTNRMDISCENVEAIYIDLYKELITIMETHNIDPKDIGEMDFKLNEFLENSYIVETNQYFTQMAHKINENLRADADKDQKFAKQIAEYIRRNYTEDIEVSKLSEEIGISYSHLRRIFRDNMKTNLTSYINELRIEDAKGLLMETDLTVAEISQRLGYNNEQSLRRYFNKIVGTTPGKFRSSQN